MSSKSQGHEPVAIANYFIDLNQTGFEKGVACEVFPSCLGNLKHAFSNKIGISPKGLTLMDKLTIWNFIKINY